MKGGVQGTEKRTESLALSSLSLFWLLKSSGLKDEKAAASICAIANPMNNLHFKAKNTQ